MKKSYLLKLFVVAAMPLACGSAFAGTATATLAVSAAVSKNCSITTTGLAFGAYDGVVANLTTALTGNGTVSVACTKGAGLSIGMGDGLTAVSAGGQRQMIGTLANTDKLQYNLLQPVVATPTVCSATAWSSATPLAIPVAPSKVARAYYVCGSIPAGQDISADAYSDTVVATINF